MKDNLLTFCQVNIVDEKKHYQLERINLILNQGDMICLTGMSSSGEDSILRYLCGEAHRIGGKVIVGGKVMAKDYIEKDMIHHFFMASRDEMDRENLNIMEYLVLVSRMKSQKLLWNENRGRKRAEDVLKAFGLDMDVFTSCKDLSPVQKRILYLAKAYAAQTKVILIQDEYEEFTEDDFKEYEKAIYLLKSTRAALLIVTKNLRFASRFADVTCIFKDYHIVKKIYKASDAYEKLYAYITSGLTSVEQKKVEKSLERYCARFKVNGQTIMIRVNGGETVILKVKDTSEQWRLFSLLSGEWGRQIQVSLDQAGWFYARKRVQYRNRIVSIRSFSGESELFGNLSVGENLMLPNVNKIKLPFLFRRKKAEKAMERQLEREIGVRISQDNLAIQYPIDAVKVLMERWRIFAPKVLILQNPFFNQDYECRGLLSEWIRELSKYGTSIIIISPNEYDYKEIFDRVINIDDRNEGYEE